nr:KamA family protein [Raoultella sp. NCTC 9187]
MSSTGCSPQLEAIPHVKRLRIHSRLPIVIPARVTEALAARFARSSLQILLVNHINHANEIDAEFRAAMARYVTLASPC